NERSWPAQALKREIGGRCESWPDRFRRRGRTGRLATRQWPLLSTFRFEPAMLFPFASHTARGVVRWGRPADGPRCKSGSREDAYKSDLGPSPLFGNEGYIVVYQDVRGRWMSEGEFVNMRPHRAQKNSPHDIDESTDTYDTIDWLIQHVPNHNGRVGMWGISY